MVREKSAREKEDVDKHTMETPYQLKSMNEMIIRSPLFTDDPKLLM